MPNFTLEVDGVNTKIRVSGDDGYIDGISFGKVPLDSRCLANLAKFWFKHQRAEGWSEMVDSHSFRLSVPHPDTGERAYMVAEEALRAAFDATQGDHFQSPIPGCSTFRFLWLPGYVKQAVGYHLAKHIGKQCPKCDYHALPTPFPRSGRTTCLIDMAEHIATNHIGSLGDDEWLGIIAIRKWSRIT